MGSNFNKTSHILLSLKKKRVYINVKIIVKSYDPSEKTLLKIKLILKLSVPPKIREPSVYMYFKLLYSFNCLYKSIAEVSIIILKNIKIRKLQSEIESMDYGYEIYRKSFLIGMMVLIFFLFVEAQTKSHISIHQPPVPFPIVHLTKREKLPLLLHDCIIYELEASTMPIHGREYCRCKVNSFEKCIQNQGT